MRNLRGSLMIPTLVAILALLAAPVGAAVRPAIADFAASGDTAVWSPQVASYDRLVLTVGGPDGFSFRQEFAAGANPTFGLFD